MPQIVMQKLVKFQASQLIIITTGYDLLASRSQHNGVLILGRITSLDVAQWRIRLDNALVAQILQCHLVFRGASAIQPALAEGQGAKVLVDGAQQLLGRLQTQWHKWQIKVLHVMRAVHVIVNQAATRRAKGFNRIKLILLHARRFATFDNRHSFASMNTCNKPKD